MIIQLRPWSLTDKKAVAVLCDGADRRFLSDRLPKPYTEADAESWLKLVMAQDGKNGIFRGITADGTLVGTISVERKEDVYRKDAEISYFLTAERWSQGIMTEAVRQICEEAFAQLDLVRITGLVYEANQASRRVLEKNGFVLEGVMQKAVLKAGVLHNLCIYGKLRDALPQA